MQRSPGRFDLTYLARFEEAAQHLEEVRRLATERGDETELIRVTWLEGRLHRGLGRRPAARFYLEQAAGQFEAKGMWYDVALARMELAGLQLEEGRTAEVKAVTPALAAAFEAEGVHAEALKALRLFQAAVDREEATPASPSGCWASSSAPGTTRRCGSRNPGSAGAPPALVTLAALGTSAGRRADRGRPNPSCHALLSKSTFAC